MGKDFKVEGDIGIGELPPGVTKRRWEPEMGINKHRERIHRDSASNDAMPFKFSKPKKPGRKSYYRCNNCDYVFQSSINTVGVICRECKEFSSVAEVLE